MDGRKNRIRIIAVAVCLWAALTLTGCATSEAFSAGKDFGEIMSALKCDLFGAEEQNCAPLQIELPVREGFRPVESKSAYASLKDETMREAYRDIESAIFQTGARRQRLL